ncbi:MAG: helix-hairpin-helix domain-containing protein [Kiritimatiellae bacterium]|nr:helix-hairpin-helix domain-containing protein [Kiritimatiellia bacterium]NLD88902.1 radical SAM protein [Lentisphaerota bacterium]
MPVIRSAPGLQDKLGILSADAQYDLSCACSCGSGDPRRRGLDNRWLYPVTLQSGGHSLMFKTLVSNVCTNDCKYCPLRAGHDVTARCSLAPEEIVRAFLPYWKSGQVIGLFLTSGVCGNPDAAMDRMLAAAELLRRRERYRGILHLKIIPGASDAAIDRALALASGVSLNIETAGESHFAKLTTRKDYRQSIIRPLRRIAALTAKGARYERVKTSTQFVVGASDETDREVVRYMGGLYGRLGLKGIYFSAYQRGLGTPDLPGENSAASNADLLAREHRLYQTDYLLRKYGFAAEEIGFDAAGNLPLDIDPKEHWARRHPERFPVDVNRAGRVELLRVPGLGPVTVRRILAARQGGGRLRSLESLGLRGARARKAAAWIAV